MTNRKRDARATLRNAFRKICFALVIVLPLRVALADTTISTNTSVSSGVKLTISSGGILNFNTASKFQVSGSDVAANSILYAGLSGVIGATPLTPFARTILDDADAVAVRATIGAPADSALLHLAGSETITGVKLYSAEPNVAFGNPSIKFTVTTGFGGMGSMQMADGLNAGHRVMSWGPNAGIDHTSPHALDISYKFNSWVIESNWIDGDGNLVGETYFTGDDNSRLFGLGRDYTHSTAGGFLRGSLLIDGDFSNIKNTDGTNILEITDNQGPSEFTGVGIRNTNASTHRVALELGGSSRTSGGWILYNDANNDKSETFGLWNNYIGGYPILVTKSNNHLGINHLVGDTLASELDVNGTTVTTKLGVGTTAVSANATVQIGSNLNTVALTDVFWGGHTGNNADVVRLRTGGPDDNGQYGFFIRTGYNAGSFVVFGTRDASTDADGLIIRGGSASVGIPTSIATPTKFTIGETAGTTPRGPMSWQSSTDANSANLNLRKSRGTFASPTTVVTGDVLGRAVFAGYDGTNYLEMGSIKVSATDTVAATRIPTKMEFQVATNAAPSVLTTAFTLNDNLSAVFSGTVAASASGMVLPNFATIKWRNADDDTDLDMLWLDDSDLFHVGGERYVDVAAGLSAKILTANPLATPLAPSLSTSGTAGSTSYSYKITAVLYDGVTGTAASAVATIATGNATLTGTNKINLAIAPVAGATYYVIYRTASGGTPSSTGRIGLTASTTFSDQGFAGDSSTPPTINTTGVIHGELAGTVTNDNATAGRLGEFGHSEVASGSAVSLTTGTAANVTSISLSAGDYDVRGNVNFAGSSSTVTSRSGGITSTSATVPTDGTEVFNGAQTTTTTETSSVSVPAKRFSLSTTTTIYLVGKATFSAGTMGGFGSISWRRVR